MDSDAEMYKTYAIYYDDFYKSKNYEKETNFLHQILSKHRVKSILDVGCGTGVHLSKLAQYGYACSGIDLNHEMLSIATTKLKENISQADMRDFDLHHQYDAIISMFAVFNHNLDVDDAYKTLAQLNNHLTQNGILILDLYNPQSSGEKVDCVEGVTRIMRWNLDTEHQMCESIVKFIEDNKTCEEIFPLKIYSKSLIKQLLEDTGFTKVQFYDNYTLNEGSSLSKNLIVVAYKII